MAKSRADKKFEALDDNQRLEYMATANRVTIRLCWKLVDNNKLEAFYVPKVRGVIVSDNEGNYQHHTPEQARAAGKETLAHWKREFYSGGKV